MDLIQIVLGEKLVSGCQGDRESDVNLEQLIRKVYASLNLYQGVNGGVRKTKNCILGWIKP